MNRRDLLKSLIATTVASALPSVSLASSATQNKREMSDRSQSLKVLTIGWSLGVMVLILGKPLPLFYVF